MCVNEIAATQLSELSLQLCVGGMPARQNINFGHEYVVIKCNPFYNGKPCVSGLLTLLLLLEVSNKDFCRP